VLTVSRNSKKLHTETVTIVHLRLTTLAQYWSKQSETWPYRAVIWHFTRDSITYALLLASCDTDRSSLCLSQADIKSINN